jgi:ATP-dependent DNA helicase RecQ
MDPRGALRDIFGFDAFRPGQEAAVQAALENRDTLVVMPTGSGKSLCYQLPALMRDDLTIVVSPLVSLMQDQARTLWRIAPGKVELINAQRGAAGNAQALGRIARGEDVRVLYVAPERFALPRFLDVISRARVGLFVVDEAHCVSQWGHDFRPDYFALAEAAASVRARATLALTATATPAVATDIVRRLALRDPLRVTTGFDRPNLGLSVVSCRNAVDKRRRLAAALGEVDALPAIVYAGTRSASEELAHELRGALGVEVLAYHAGLDRGVRHQTQERFMSGEVPVIVATNAFGMGIDKADVRTVAHAAVPASLEAYYQEVGRGGRDGQPARGLLFAEQKDKALHVFFIQRSRVEDGVFERVGERLRWAGLDGSYDLAVSELAGLTGARDADEAARSIIGHLARAGMIRPSPAPPDRIAGQIIGEWDRRTLGLCQSSARDGERARWAQYRSIWDYVERPQCRRRALLVHFGDHSDPAPLGGCCDVCDGNEPEWATDAFGRRQPPGAAGARDGSGAGAAGSSAVPGDLDDAIVSVVRTAQPSVGRTRAVEILRGGRSKIIAEHAYDELPEYGSFAHLRSGDVLGRVDELLEAGTLSSSGGRFPKLRASAPTLT